MSVVIEKKQCRTMRAPRARGVKIVLKAEPMTTDEMIRLVEKARLEKDQGKVSQLTDQILDGFYGRKIVAV